MSPRQNFTYLLAPNWDCTPEGPIALGNIIANPFTPHRVLSRPTADAPIPKIQTSTQVNWYSELEDTRDFNFNLWTRIFELSKLEVGAHHIKNEGLAVEMTRLDTIYFSEDPSEENIRLRAQSPNISSRLGLNSRFFHRPVYMITGLKIARGFKLTRSTSSAKGSIATVDFQLAPEGGVGGNAEYRVGARRERGFEAANDIVFAYQLLRIKSTGWGQSQHFDVDEHRDKAAFLSDSDSDGEETWIGDDSNLEIDRVSLEDMAQTAKKLNAGPFPSQNTLLFDSS